VSDYVIVRNDAGQVNKTGDFGATMRTALEASAGGAAPNCPAALD